MFRNYLIIAFRHLVRYRAVSVFNILGLSLGIAVCITIFIYVRFETSFDNYHPHVNRLFRVEKISKRFNESEKFASVPVYIGDAIQNFEEVELMGRFGPWRSNVVRYQDHAYKEDGIFTASPGLFRVFGMEVLEGNPAAGMERPMTVTLTESIAFKYFGSQSAIGEMIEIDTSSFEVVGIIEDFPYNTHARLRIIISEISMKTLVHFPEEVMQGSHHPTYIRLHTWADPDAFEKKIRNLAHELKAEMLAQRGEQMECSLRPVTEIHMNAGQLNWDSDPGGNRVFIYLLSVIGFLILLMTCFNYMNLSTAQYSIRSFEVGIRKTNGASRKKLISQFLGESMIITLISYITGMFLVELFLPLLNLMGGLALDIRYNDPALILFLLFLVLFIGILAGSYPALFLSSFSPVSAIRAYQGKHSNADRFRKILVIGQYAISITLIMATMIVFKQLLYMKNQAIGFSKETKLVIEFPENVVNTGNYRDVKEEFMRHAGVRATSISSSVPGRWRYWWRIWPTDEEDSKTRMLNCMQVDYDFISNYELELVAGRAFDPSLSDSTNAGWILNEAAMKGYGWNSPEEAMNHTLSDYGTPIIGVFRDYHFQGLQNPIDPLGMFLISEDFRYITLVYEVAALEEVLTHAEQTFRELFPRGVFDYFFLDDDFERQYSQERWISRLVLIFTVLGVLIASLGLIGMISFSLENRKLEIGIRKVNGARAKHVYALLIRDFSLSIGIAFAISSPAAWFGGKAWLKDFAFQTDLNWWIFLSALLMAWILAVGAISLQSLKAARQSPMNILRYE